MALAQEDIDFIKANIGDWLLELSVGKRFDALTKRMDRFMIWSFGVTVSVAGVVIAGLRWT